jgi:hypothetical protein
MLSFCQVNQSASCLLQKTHQNILFDLRVFTSRTVTTSKRYELVHQLKETLKFWRTTLLFVFGKLDHGSIASFRRNRKRRENTRPFADFFGSYLTGSHKLDKKIGSRKNFHFPRKPNFGHILSFYQIYGFTSNKLQKTHQKIPFHLLTIPRSSELFSKIWRFFQKICKISTASNYSCLPTNRIIPWHLLCCCSCPHNGGGLNSRD